MRSLSSAVVLACVLLAGPAPLRGQFQAQRVLSFDSRYALSTYSNDAFGRFGIEALDLAAYPAEAITLEGSGGNLLRGIALAVGTDFVARAYKLSYHEFGHGTRAAAAGFRPHFGFGAAPSDAEVSELLASGSLHGTFFGLFFGSFFRQSGYTFLPADDFLFTPPGPAELDASGWNLVWIAGGLNNEMLITERVEERLRRGGGHAGMLSSWLRGKVSTIRYAGGNRTGDVESILGWYQDKGYEIERRDLHQASYVSVLLSPTTYELLYRFGRVLDGDSIRFRPWAPYGVELPSISFYMNAAGLSYRVTAGYQLGRWRFPLAVERVYNGSERTEVTVGGEWDLAHTYVGARVTVGEQLGAAVSVDRRVGDRFVVSGRLRHVRQPEPLRRAHDSQPRVGPALPRPLPAARGGVLSRGDERHRRDRPGADDYTRRSQGPTGGHGPPRTLHR